MTTETTKPYAGNTHVGFGEGEVAPVATPRRGISLYRIVKFVMRKRFEPLFGQLRRIFLCMVFAFCCGVRLYAVSSWLTGTGRGWSIPGTYHCGWYEDGISYYFETEDCVSCMGQGTPSDYPEELIFRSEITVTYRGRTYTFRLPFLGTGLRWDVWPGTYAEYLERCYQKYGYYDLGGGAMTSAGQITRKVVVQDGIEAIAPGFFNSLYKLESIRLPNG